MVVDAIPFDHGMAVENLAYRVECGGRVVFHLGDAVPSEANFARLTRRPERRTWRWCRLALLHPW